MARSTASSTSSRSTRRAPTSAPDPVAVRAADRERASVIPGTILPPSGVERVLTDGTRRIRLSELFAGEDYAHIRNAVLKDGHFHDKQSGRKLYVQTVPIAGVQADEDREIVAIAAVARDPGITQDYIDSIQDYLNKTQGSRAKTIQQYWNIYRQNGIVNNAVNKYAALLSVGGRFNVRSVRKGKQQKALDNAEYILDYFNRNVNAPVADGIATPSRGLKALTEQGIRIALVEGDFMAREVWNNHAVGTLGSFSLPLTIQTLSMEFMSPLDAMGGLGEFWYWTPPSTIKSLITGDVGDLPKPAKNILKQLFDKDLIKQVKNDGKALLDPALLLHVKHRGSDRDIYGESFIEPAKQGIRYMDSVTNTDMVSMESVINRLLIIMVGSSDPASPYSKADVAVSRTQLMQSFFEDSGPSMTIVWQGDDVKVEQVSAMDNILDLEKQHKIAERKVVIALGIPSALLDGTTNDGSSAAWASLIAASGMAEHLGGSFARIWTELGIRILEENNFTDIDIEYEYDRSNLVDKEQERNQNRNDYTIGLLSIRSAVAAAGRDPDAEFFQRCQERGLDPEATTWEVAFMPPQGLQGQGAPSDTQNDQLSETPSSPTAPTAPAAPAKPRGQGPGKVPGNGRTPNDQVGKSPTTKPSTTAPAPKKK